MPTLVHLADKKETVNIRKNGIKIGKYRQGVFCMPVLPNFYVSHQWLRELKRNGARTFVGVYFKLDDKTLVFAGKYNQKHRHITLAKAIKEIMSLEDPLGYELITDRKITPKEIEKIKALPQKLGWRYCPSSHNQKPACACPMCIPFGSIKGKILREKIEPSEKSLDYYEIIEKLKVESDENEINSLLWKIKKTTRRADPTGILFLLDRQSDVVNESLALALGAYKHKKTKQILLQLLENDNENTREFSADSLLKLYGNTIMDKLISLDDKAINQALNNWKEKRK